MKCFWRNHSVLQSVLEHKKKNTCGDLRSLRFTWQRPSGKASASQTFLYEIFAAALDGAEYVAESKICRLNVEKVVARNNLFAIAALDNGMTAEFELNECLPDTMPDTCFLKANFSHGHITNQPVVGHFNEEGMIYATSEKLSYPIAEKLDIVANGPIEQMVRRFQECGTNADRSDLQQLIKEALHEEA